jgi:hypothetical protein
LAVVPDGHAPFAELAAWLKSRWEEKEARLDKFYAPQDVAERRFDIEPSSQRRWPVGFHTSESLPALQIKIDPFLHGGLVISAVFWIITAVVWLNFFVTLTSMRYAWRSGLRAISKRKGAGSILICFQTLLRVLDLRLRLHRVEIWRRREIGHNAGETR